MPPLSLLLLLVSIEVDRIGARDREIYPERGYCGNSPICSDSRGKDTAGSSHSGNSPFRPAT